MLFLSQLIVVSSFFYKFAEIKSKEMKRILPGSFLLFLLVSMTSCATLFKGGNPVVTIDGDTPDYVTIITDVKTYDSVCLPYKVEVKRHKIAGKRIQVIQEGKSYRDVVLKKSVNSWTFGNILIGGLIGWGIDLITNCVVEPSNTYFYLEEKKQ